MSRHELIALALLLPLLAGAEDAQQETRAAGTRNQVEEAPLDDPTRPPDYLARKADSGGSTRKTAGILTLQEVLVASGRKFAVINGQALQEGDWVDGARLVEIRDRVAILRRGGQNLNLKLFDRTVKKPSGDGNQADDKGTGHQE